MRLSAAVLLAAAISPAAAGAAQVQRESCAKGIRVAATGEPLSAVLRELSRELGFALRYEADADPAVDADLTRPPVELVRKLTTGQNLVLEDGPDPRCRGRRVPVRVWLLPRGGASPPAPHATSAMDVYRRAHGLPPEPAPGAAAATSGAEAPPETPAQAPQGKEPPAQ